jgi:hypothetical protein
MTTRSAMAAATAAVAAMGIVAAAQQTTSRPGDMTDARVWVQNRTPADAVAVSVTDVTSKRPVSVHVTNGDAGDTLVVQSRAARQLWDYETITASRTELAAALSARGAAGWEAVGVLSSTAEESTILLKRPR